MAETTPGVRTITLQDGECVTIPANSVIQAIVLTGTASITSTCDNLPEPENYKCGFFAMVMDQDDNPGHSMDEQNTYYVSLKVGGNTYLINELIIQGENPGTPTGIGTLNLHITSLPLFEFKAVTANTSPSKRQLIWLFFQTPESLFDSLELKIQTFGNEYFLRPYEHACGDYPNPS